MFKLNNKKTLKLSCFLVPVIFGLWSLILGQDRNVDFASYHIYNAFSFLNNKIAIDYAAAGINTYLNPLLDSFYYLLNTNLNVYLFGFLIGFIHGLIYPILIGITFLVLPDLRAEQDYKTLMFLALSGCLTANYLAGLGNSMGDVTTSLFCLTSLLILFKYWNEISQKDQSIKKITVLIFAGSVIGIATALKLTNAPFALAMMLSFLFAGGSSLKKNIYSSLYFGIGVVIGILAASGFWYLRLWGLFQNPLFPMFSHLFNGIYFPELNSSPYELWVPKNLSQKIFWPYIFTFDYHKVGEGLFRQILWPVFYTLTIFLFIKIVINLKSIKKKAYVNDPQQFVILFISLSYLIWMNFFSIIRYTVTIEVLLPLAIFILLKNFFKNNGSRYAKRIIIISTLITLSGGYGTWGHTKWASPPFFIEKPLIANPEKAAVFLVGGSPIAWVISQMPNNLSFISIGGYSGGDQERLYINDLIKKRIGDKYALFPGTYNWRVDNVKKWNSILSSLGLLNSKDSCKKLDGFIASIKFRGKIKSIDGISEHSCYLDIKDSDFVDINKANKSIINTKNDFLSRYGYKLVKSSCQPYKARLGNQNWSYIWCEVSE